MTGHIAHRIILHQQAAHSQMASVSCPRKWAHTNTHRLELRCILLLFYNSWPGGAALSRVFLKIATSRVHWIPVFPRFEWQLLPSPFLYLPFIRGLEPSQEPNRSVPIQVHNCNFLRWWFVAATATGTTRAPSNYFPPPLLFLILLRWFYVGRGTEKPKRKRAIDRFCSPWNSFLFWFWAWENHPDNQPGLEILRRKEEHSSPCDGPNVIINDAMNMRFSKSKNPSILARKISRNAPD